MTTKKATRAAQIRQNRNAKKHSELAAAVTRLNLLTNQVGVFSRTKAAASQLDGRKNINFECDYPDTVSLEMLTTMYNREGVATRVVALNPESTWQVDPMVNETEDSDITEFEEAFNLLQEMSNLYHYLYRLDELAGVGWFGCLLFGFSDGGKLSDPVPGLDETGLPIENPPENKLLFIRVFEQSLVDIATYETNPLNPRYGLPTSYNVKFFDLQSGVGQSAGPDSSTHNVHWTRMLHFADGTSSNEVFGLPRQLPVFNRLLDVRKILGGSGEMFWKGGFQGLSFEVDPTIADEVTLDEETLKKRIEEFELGLKRYIALIGLQTKTLSSQIADPTPHLMAQMKPIAIYLKVPLRIFIGSEEAQLASAEDVRNWNGRVARRQNKVAGPQLLRPAIQRLIDVGCLPKLTKEETFTIEWPDLNSPSAEDKAKVAERITNAIVKYVTSGADSLFPPEFYLTRILDFSAEEAESILEEVRIRIEDEVLSEEEELDAVTDEGEPEDDEQDEDEVSDGN